MHSAMLVHSVYPAPYSKHQVVSFLVDETTSVGSGNYALIKQFITNYIAHSQDEPAMTSLSFYDSAVENVVSLSSGNTQATILAALLSHSCRCNNNAPNLGAAINTTTNNIIAKGYAKGVPKIIVAIVGSTSVDNVYYASEYARANGVTIIVIGVGSSYTNAQLQSIAFSTSNLLYVSNYALLPQYYTVFFNYMSKQYRDVVPGETISGNIVRNVNNPLYFRIPRSSTAGTFHKVTITHRKDP